MHSADPPFVLEGLRLLPAWQYAISKGRQSYANCTECKAGATTQIRQSWRCPYLTPSPPDLERYTHAPCPDGASPPPDHEQGTPWPTVCPGYSTSLPETIEVARAWGWAERGDLRAFTQEQPTEALVDAIELFGDHVDRLKTKLMTPRSKGGLADE